MVKKVLTLAIIALLGLSVASAQTAQELIQKHLKAQGLDKMNGHQTLSIAGTISSPQMPDPIVFTSVYKLPMKARMELKIMNSNIVIASNGKDNWGINPMSGSNDPQDIPAQGLGQVKQILELLKGPLYDAIKDTSSTLEAMPVEEIEGNSYNVVQITDAEKNVIKVYLNAISGWMYKVNQKYDQNGETHVVDTYMKNYTKIAGMVFPQLVETYADGSLGTKIEFTKITVDDQLQDSLFDKPVK